MKTRPDIAISSCILGNAVRYDGESKYLPEICTELQQHFNLIAVCPEVEIGLGVPRPPVQLTGNPDQPEMTGRDNPDINVTDKMRTYCHRKPPQLNHIYGYVFKSKSPSCGIHGIPVFDHGNIIDNDNRGLFADAMIKLYPDLPISDEVSLMHPEQRHQFIQQVLHYYQTTKKTDLNE